MALDPSVILQAKQPDLPNPLDSAVKAMTMRDLMVRSQAAQTENQVRGLQLQQAQRDADDQQTVRTAYQNNMTEGPDGIPVVDKAGFLGELGQKAPWLQQQKALEFSQMDIQKQQRQLEFAQNQSARVMDQGSYDQFRSSLVGAGMPDNLPKQFDPNWFQNYQLHLQSIQNQNDYKFKQADISIKQSQAQSEMLKAKAAAAEAGIPYGGAGGGGGGAPGASSPTGQPGKPQASGAPQGFSPPPKMQAEAMKTYLQNVASSRQEPDTQRALLDVQSADKINEALRQAPGGDANKLNNNQVHLVTGELVKLATGGAPTETELKEMTPDTLVQKYAGVIQNLTGKSVPANAKEFIDQFKDYANGIGKQGMDRVTGRMGEIADDLRPQLGEQQYQLVKNQAAHKFDSSLTRKVLRLQELRAKAGGS